MRRLALTVLTVMVAVSTPALAWGPYGPMPPPAPWFDPGQAPQPPWTPGLYGPPVDAPQMPAVPPTWPDAQPAPPGSAERLGPARAQTHATRRAHVAIARRTSPEGYLIEIALQNVDPAQIQVIPRGRGLRIQYRTATQDLRRDTFDGGSSQSYSHVSGSMTRHVPLPPDADLAGLSQEVTQDRILLRVPRLTRPDVTPYGVPSWP
jgi:hypothetical protein